MNAHRGDVSALIDGSVRGLRLTFEGLAGVEAALQSGIVAVAERFRRHEVGTPEVAAILREGLKGGGHVVGEAALRAAMMEMGFIAATKLAAHVLATGLGIENGAQEGAAPQAPGKPAAAGPWTQHPFPGQE